VGKVEKKSLSVNVWYTFMLVSRWNKIDVYLLKEEMFESKQMTAEDKKTFMNTNTPFMSF